MAYRRNVATVATVQPSGNLCPLCSSLLARSKFAPYGLYCSNFKNCKYKCNDVVKKVATGNTIAACSTLSDEQAAILEAVNGDDNVIVNALAGTGKTFVLVQTVRVLSQERGLSVLCLAFAKRDKESLTERVCGRATVKTSNGAGWACLAKYCKSRKCRLETDNNISRTLLNNQLKMEGLLTTDNGKWECDVPMIVVNSVIELVDKARQILPLSVSGKKAPNDNDYTDIMSKFGIEVQAEHLPQVYAWASSLFGQMVNLNNVGIYGADYCNQLFLPSYYDLPPDQLFDRVLVDETQDQSYVTRRIAELHLKPTSRLVAVGDRYQAVYGWRGADSDSMGEMERMMERHGGTPVQLPLTLCRRCDHAIIETAQTIVPAIQALTEAGEGEVRKIESDKDFIDELTRERKGLILCRANAPSISICLKLLSVGVSAAMVRSDIVNQLLKLITRLSPDETTIPDFLAKLAIWQEEQLAKFAKYPDGASRAQLVNDKTETLRALSLADDVKIVEDLKQTIDKLFPARIQDSNGIWIQSDQMPLEERSKKIVLFSTVHGAKGGEADSVYLYSPDSGKTSLWDSIWSDPADRDNVLYVAITRAKHRLTFAGKSPSLQRLSEL